jgi:hypothetical protein
LKYGNKKKCFINCFLNIYLLFLSFNRSYINNSNIAYDLIGSGDPIFIPINESDNPPVYQIYHDVSDQADLILAEKRLVARRLSEIFQNAKIE